MLQRNTAKRMPAYFIGCRVQDPLSKYFCSMEYILLGLIVGIGGIK